MKAVSRWANRHARLAIALLIGCELINGFGGVLLGANALSDLPGVTLLLLGVLAVGVAIGVRSSAAARITGPAYDARRWRLAVAFGSNWLIWIVLGAYWSHSVQTATPAGTAQASRRVIVRSDTLIEPADARQKPVIVRDGDGYPISRSRKPTDVSPDEQQKNKRFGFFMLFLLGVFLTYASASIACSIACSGYGALAAVTFALGLGFLAGSVYFIARTAERPVVPLREQSPKQRRRTLRRFWLSWLILIGIFSVSLLTCGR